MEKITFKDWVFLTDKTYNENIYQNHNFEHCECLYCENFEAYKENIFPREVLDLFDKLGVDYRKYAEIMYIFDENGQYHYYGWYHFRGEFHGVDAKIKIDDDSFQIETISITNECSLGFHYDNSQSFFPSEDTLVQVAFDVQIPWVIDKLP